MIFHDSLKIFESEKSDEILGSKIRNAIEVMSCT